MTPHNKKPVGAGSQRRCSCALTATLVMEDNVFQSILVDTDMKKQLDTCPPCLSFPLVPPNWDLQERQAAKKKNRVAEHSSSSLASMSHWWWFVLWSCAAEWKHNLFIAFLVYYLLIFGAVASITITLWHWLEKNPQSITNSFTRTRAWTAFLCTISLLR